MALSWREEASILISPLVGMWLCAIVDHVLYTGEFTIADVSMLGVGVIAFSCIWGILGGIAWLRRQSDDALLDENHERNL